MTGGAIGTIDAPERQVPAEPSPAPSAVAPTPNADPVERIAGYGGQVVVLSMHRFAWSDVPWAISQMQWSKRPLGRLPSIGFHKLMGTGGGAGFSTRPNLRVWTILSTWPDGAAALAGIEGAPFRAKAGRAAETATIFLAPLSARGRWAAESAFVPADVDPAPDGPIAALTRATVRPGALARFWRRVPSISATIEGEAAVRFMIGMGEVPYLHQVTFSIWDDAEAMRRFSRESATHGEAVRRVAEEGWFSEQLFARFRPLGAVGRWNGRDAAALIAPARSAQAAA